MQGPLHGKSADCLREMYELLQGCENEMRYAGWDKLEADNVARNGVYEQVKQYLEKNAAAPTVQEPFGYLEIDDIESQREYPHNCRNVNLWHEGGEGMVAIYTAQPAAQPAVPDAFGTREGEHPQYIQGWNDCRAEMLKGMKP
jgi:hypothetical protein